LKAVTADAPESTSQRLYAALARLQAKVERYLPWLSLVMSVVGAVVMDRSEAQGPWVAASAAGSWLVFVLVSIVHRPPVGADAPAPGRLRQLLRFGSTAAGQSLIQLPLFFSAPFYWEACAFTPSQCVFAVLFVGAALISLWDPWCNAALLRPLLGPMLLAFASFVGFNAALPMLGVPHRVAAWISAAVVGVGLPAAELVRGAQGRQRINALLVGLAIPVALAAGAMRAVPPAPLRVVSTGIGTQVVDRTLLDPQTRLLHSPGALVCFSAVRAPHGLKDKLFHVWTLDGTEFYRLELTVQGGRRAGFRTWSRAHVPRATRGIVQCAVETGLGQILARSRLSLGS
jgi:hypothetical protein